MYRLDWHVAHLSSAHYLSRLHAWLCFGAAPSRLKELSHIAADTKLAAVAASLAAGEAPAAGEGTGSAGAAAAGAAEQGPGTAFSQRKATPMEVLEMGPQVRGVPRPC